MVLHSLISAADDEHQTRASRSARIGVETGLQLVEPGKDIFNCLLCVGVLGRTAAKEQIGTSLQQRRHPLAEAHKFRLRRTVDVGDRRGAVRFERKGDGVSVKVALPPAGVKRRF